MSPLSVCQGLQSCLDPRVIEPRVLRLKLAPPGSNISLPSESESHHPQETPVTNHELEEKDTTSPNMGGWSFLQALSHTSSSHCNKTTEDKVYVHPTVKRSSSMLSDKSLEMCTESLGSETGGNASEISDDTSLLSFESSNSFMRHDDNTPGANTSAVAKRANRACSFPPPLTSLTDFGGVHVRPHREDGRLILEAVASPSPDPYFHAERSDGRLRLRLFESSFASECDEVDDGEGVDEEWSHEGEGEEEEEEEEEYDDDDEMQNQEACGEEETRVEEELEECVENVEGEMGVTKFGRPSRCKESGNRDIFGDGYFELPSLSLCLWVELVLLLLSLSLSLVSFYF